MSNKGGFRATPEASPLEGFIASAHGNTGLLEQCPSPDPGFAEVVTIQEDKGPPLPRSIAEITS